MLPPLIDHRYRLRRVVTRGQSVSQKGIYLDRKTGTEVFVKIDSKKHSLEQEFSNHRFFYHLSKRFPRSPVTIPKPLALITFGSRCALIMEYVAGAKSLLKTDPTTRIRTYMHVLTFLRDVTTHSSDVKSPLRTRSPAFQLLALPYFFCKNVFLYPTHGRLFLRAAMFILSHSANWLKVSSSLIAHGDVNVDNILLLKRRIVLLDFSTCYRSHRYYSLSRALNSSWFQESFHQLLWQEIVREFRLPLDEQRILRSFVVYNLLQRLSQRYPHQQQEHVYLHRLREIVSSSPYSISAVLTQAGYREVRPLEKDSFGRFHGVVTDRLGKKFFVKAVVGRNSYRYRSLETESEVTARLSVLTKREHIKSGGYRLRVPLVARVIHHRDVLCLISQYIDGQQVLDQTPRVQAALLSTSLDLMSKLGAKVEKKHFSSAYSRIFILLHLPTTLLKAIVLNPQETSRFISAATKVLPLLFTKTGAQGFVHGDINASNIRYSGKTIYLTDWEEAGWGMTSYNTIAPVCVHWEVPPIRDQLLTKLRANKGFIPEVFPLIAYRTLILFNQALEKYDGRRMRDFQLLTSVARNSILKPGEFGR